MRVLGAWCLCVNLLVVLTFLVVLFYFFPVLLVNLGGASAWERILWTGHFVQGQEDTAPICHQSNSKRVFVNAPRPLDDNQFAVCAMFSFTLLPVPRSGVLLNLSPCPHGLVALQIIELGILGKDPTMMHQIDEEVKCLVCYAHVFVRACVWVGGGCFA